jgi:hypothetical protein
MKLPKMFKSWVEFANHCNDKFPQAENVHIIEDDTETAFPIEKINTMLSVY